MRLVTVTLVANKCFIFVRQLKLFARKRNPDFPLESMRLMKLADKYHLDVVKNEIVSRLSADWPKDLEQWDLADVCGEFYIHAGHFICLKDWPEDLLPEPISAALLAKEGRVTGILTSVFYDMYRVKRDSDWDKGTHVVSYFFKGARWSLATTEQMPSIFINLEGNCETADECQPLLTNKRNEVTSEVWRTRDPIAVLRQLRHWSSEGSSGLCGSCEEMVFTGTGRARDSIWSQITKLVESS